MCIDCGLPTMLTARARRCAPCSRLRANARAKAWYNANVDRAAASDRAWIRANLERHRAYRRTWKRSKRPVKICAAGMCDKIIELGQVKFCRECGLFFRGDRKRRVA